MGAGCQGNQPVIRGLGLSAILTSYPLQPPTGVEVEKIPNGKSFNRLYLFNEASIKHSSGRGLELLGW